MIAALLAAAYTFTASATGVEKGTPLEFLFAGKGSDRDYETMFVLDGSVGELCEGIEKSGIPRGRPVDATHCRLWPVGCRVTLQPPLADFVDSDIKDDLRMIYTGGLRDPKGLVLADSEMPLAALCFYTLGQSPLVFDGLFDQGQVYNRHKAKVELKKGVRITFTISWDGNPGPEHLDLTVRPGNAPQLIERLKVVSAKGDVDVLISFADDLSVQEATAFAKSLSVLDSPRIRINGRSSDGFFYRAFLPLVKWRDRTERLTQPFEVIVGDPDRILFIHEDWSGVGLDPKLSEESISYDDMKRQEKTDTVFFFTTGVTTVGRLAASLKHIPKTVRNHYVYWD